MGFPCSGLLFVSIRVVWSSIQAGEVVIGGFPWSFSLLRRSAGACKDRNQLHRVVDGAPATRRMAASRSRAQFRARETKVRSCRIATIFLCAVRTATTSSRNLGSREIT
jgi:hypothetical protein